VKDTLYKLLSRLSAAGNHASGPGLSSATVAAYNAARGKPNASHLCHAPFTNMYFNVHGDCAPCWLTFLEPDSYPAKSVHDIWFGEKFQAIRSHILNYDLTHKCSVCLKNLQTGNYTSVLARAYDINDIAKYPAMLELEVANTCNLECVMCIGELSSSIRRNREKLPPLQSPYDDAFADQLEEFIPHLRELRFNGGEPFLIDLVYKILEKTERLNPKVKVVIATNGTVLNNRVKNVLNRHNIHINLSLDSLTPEIYETIRVNAKFHRVMEHVLFYREYTKANHRTMCLMVNPMRNNWHEMPEFIRFVNRQDINIWFNTIHRPVEWAIWSLPADELKHIYHTLASVSFEKPQTGIAAYNLGIYKNLVEVQIKNWWREAQEREAVKQLQASKLTAGEAEAVVKKKLTDFIYTHINEGEEQKKYRLDKLHSKLDQINQRVHERNGDIDFYNLIIESPPDVLYTQLESRSVNMLVEEFENFFLQKVSG